MKKAHFHPSDSRLELVAWYAVGTSCIETADFKSLSTRILCSLERERVIDRGRTRQKIHIMFTLFKKTLIILNYYLYLLFHK